MRKYCYFKLESNGDLSVVLDSLEVCADLINTNLQELTIEEAKETFYTITPIYLTDKEYRKLGEWEG